MKNTLKGFAVLLLLAAPMLLTSKGWAGEWTDKSYHSDETHTYKHPNQRSFTGPFDYGGKSQPAPARVEVSDNCNCFTFDATKSTDVDGQRLSYLWDFGDGQTSDKAVVQHCYEKPGSYNVTLTVKDSSGMTCDTGVTSSKVEANTPAQASAGPAKEACIGQSVQFDSSASTAGSQTWDFGDGETGTTGTHTYQKAGNYRVLLTVDDGKGTKCSVAQSSTTVRINDNAFVTLAGVESTCVGRTVSFDAQGSGGKYTWDFGDGETWTGGSRASHTYNKVGTHTVTVTVDDGSGSSCSTASDRKTITVNEPPVAKIGDIASCLVSDPVSFDGSASSTSTGTLSYLWNFGDGETAEGAKVSHQYAKAGSYRVTLTVRNGAEGNCSAASDSAVVTVNSRPDAVISIS